MRPNTGEAEAHLLLTEAGRALLAEVSPVPRPGPADLARWRKRATAELVAAAVRLAECRRRAAAKFTRADAMWLEPTGLEQATAEPVARHKAVRFAGARVVDLCCGIGGDTLALAEKSEVIAVDRDLAMARRCSWNSGVYGAGNRVLAVSGDAQRFEMPPGTLVHVDPDRRAHPGKSCRAVRLDGYEPALSFLHELIHSVPGGALKLGPASDFEAHFGSGSCEIELISLRGECKEATIWFGRLASCRRRATLLPAGVSWTDRDRPARSTIRLPSEVASIKRWVFSPDPALVRAGLLDGFAAAHGLQRMSAGVDILTATELVASPFLSAFEVLEELPVDLKRLRSAVARLGLGPLEIKVRGLDLRPETLRSQLRPPGPNPATLLLVGGPGLHRAILAQRRD